jgi:uncharacterized protein with GYD domain
VNIRIDKVRWRTIKEARMGLYISLCNWTEQGIKNVKQTTKRLDAARKAAAKQGITIRDTYYTMGKYDFVVISDAPNDEALSRFLLSIGALGNAHTLTMRAFTVDEMNGIIGKM